MGKKANDFKYVEGPEAIRTAALEVRTLLRNEDTQNALWVLLNRIDWHIAFDLETTNYLGALVHDHLENPKPINAANLTRLEATVTALADKMLQKMNAQPEAQPVEPLTPEELHVGALVMHVTGKYNNGPIMVVTDLQDLNLSAGPPSEFVAECQWMVLHDSGVNVARFPIAHLVLVDGAD